MYIWKTIKSHAATFVTSALRWVRFAAEASRLGHGKTKIVFAVIAFSTAQVFALGLGEIKTNSHLGEPLTSSITVIGDASYIDSDNLRVRSIRAAEASAMGVEILPLEQPLEFLIKRNGGEVIIEVTSELPVNEPFFNVFVELEWPNGAVYKEFSVLVDPPSVAVKRSANKPALATTPSARQPTSTTDNRSTNSGAARVTETADTIRYKVQSGDSLTVIARRMSADTGMNAKQLSDWILTHNPNAFIRGNPNLIKAGAVLKMPGEGSAAPGGEPVTSIERVATTTPDSQSTVFQEAPADLIAEVDEAIAQAEAETVTQTETAGEVRGLLTVTSATTEDGAQELLDMLSRENEALREKLVNLENSEYLNTMREIATSQRQQIAQLHDRLGVDGNAYREEADKILKKMDAGIEVEQETPSLSESVDLAGTGQFDNPENTTKGILQIDAFVPESLRTPGEKRNYFFFWVITSAVIFFAFLFLAMFFYYRRLVKAKDALAADNLARLKKPITKPVSRTADASVSLPYGAQSTTLKRSPSELDKPIDMNIGVADDKLEPTMTGKQNADWFGEQLSERERKEKNYEDTVKQVQAEFANMFGEESALDENAIISDEESDAMEGLTTPWQHESEKSDSEDDVTKDKKVTGLFGRKKKGGKDGELVAPSDEDLRMSIAEKMSNYSPTGGEHTSNAYGLDAFGLDEILGEDDMIGDEVDSLLYRSKLYCEARKYKQALKMIEAAMEEIDDQRLEDEFKRVGKFVNVEVEEKPA